MRDMRGGIIQVGDELVYVSDGPRLTHGIVVKVEDDRILVRRMNVASSGRHAIKDGAFVQERFAKGELVVPKKCWVHVESRCLVVKTH